MQPDPMKDLAALLYRGAVAGPLIGDIVINSIPYHVANSFSAFVLPFAGFKLLLAEVGKLRFFLYNSAIKTTTANEKEGEGIDRFILGCMNAELAKEVIKPEDIDRTIVRIPGAENLVLIYNKYQDKENKERGIRMTSNIPELGLVLNSRCIICRMDDEGTFASIEDEDFDKVMQYLAR